MGHGRSAVATPKRDERPAESRWSARRKADAVVRLLRGESLDELSRELRVEAHRLQAWRDEFLAGGIEGLKAKPLQPEDRKLKEAERKIAADDLRDGELTLENEVLRAATRKRGSRSRRGSGRDTSAAGARPLLAQASMRTRRSSGRRARRSTPHDGTIIPEGRDPGRGRCGDRLHRRSAAPAPRSPTSACWS